MSRKDLSFGRGEDLFFFFEEGNSLSCTKFEICVFVFVCECVCMYWGGEGGWGYLSKG